jgi:pyruvate,water dikinase
VLIDLVDATRATSGGKAEQLAALLRAGLAVPPGFVVPMSAYEQALAGVDVVGAARVGAHHARRVVEQVVLAPALVEEIAAAVDRIGPQPGDSYVAVRSSASTEDGIEATAAGQHDTFLGVRGADQVVEAVRRCWASLWSERAVAYRRHGSDGSLAVPPATAVLVQRLVEADVAGVLFTGAATRIEASWGLGESVVGGRVTPDAWVVTDGVIVDRAVGAKTSRTDLVGTNVQTRPVPPSDRNRPCLPDQDVRELARVGRLIERVHGGRQDVEWAIADGQVWILQARPITADLPEAAAAPTPACPGRVNLTGTPASPGRATGPVRLVRGPSDFARLRTGDILVCRTTDPAWTALFGVAAAVVTETGGLLSHAAIVAREYGLPAVVAVTGATTVLRDGAMVAVDGSSGRVVRTAD